MAVVIDAAFMASPAGGDDPVYGDDKIREFKLAMKERLEKEHNLDLTEAGAQPRQGLHKEGSGVAFFADTAPTTRNGVALGASDKGLMWFTSAGQEFVWSGTAWVFVGAYKTEARITSGSGNWTVPDGVFRIRVKCIGGGGGGGAAGTIGPALGYYIHSGGGGGGGTIISDVPWSYITVTPGASIAYVVGAAGAAGADGGTTTFAGASVGYGGFAGSGGNPGDGPAVIGSHAGFAGNQHVSTTTTVVLATGGHGGGSHGGKTNSSGTPAAASYGGGGAGGSINGTTTHAAGAGGSGLIILEY